jgi:lipopolysaccharide export system permease protein
MIIDRYLIREIVKPFFVIWAVLTILITSYGAARFLSDAVNGLLPMGMLVRLVGFRTLIAFDVLIPISLYLAVVIALGRMQADCEFTAMVALGVKPARVAAVVAILSAGIALGVGGLSLFSRPWAYERSHELSDRAAASLNTRNMQAGAFYVDRGKNRTIFIGRRDVPGTPGRDVFVQLRLADGTRVIEARSVEQTSSAPGASGPEIHLIGAHVYDIHSRGAAADLVMNVNDLTLRLPALQVRPPEYSSVAASTAHLTHSDSPADRSELEWRLSTAVTTVLLGILGVQLSRSRPREQQYARLGMAILIYAAYYLAYESVRTWVQSGRIPTFPGLWWVPAALAACMLAASFAARSLSWRRPA